MQDFHIEGVLQATPHVWVWFTGPYPALDTGGFFFAKMSAIFN